MTVEQQRKLEEEQIKNTFSELQKKLEDLKNEVQTETDDSKKQEKNNEIQKLEKELSEIKTLIDTLSSLQEAGLQSLKTRLESTKKAYQEYRWEAADLQNEKFSTPTTYELLKDSETYNRLRNIISSNPDKFKDLPWNTPEKKLEYIFLKIRNNIKLFLKNKLWNAERYNKVIDNTIAPAMEWNIMELLRNQWNETNVNMLKWIDKISRDSFSKLVSWVWDFAKNIKWSFNKFSQWVNAIDYLSVHNWILYNPEKSAVLTSPIEFKNYLNDSLFASEQFSPYSPIDKNIFKVDWNQNFKFWISLQEKQKVLDQIWNIQVANNPKTTSLITKMLNKSEKFLGSTSWLQKTANGLLDWVNAINSVTKFFWMDILWEFNKAPEKRSFIYKIIDFVCKLIWITWWLEWIVKRWRLDRLNLTDEKNENISQIFNEYQKLVWKWNDVSITDENSCKTALTNFELTSLNNQSKTKWDHLRDVISDNIDINLVSPYTVQHTLGNEYLKKETVIVNWKQQEKITVNTSKITKDKKKEMVHKHIVNMKTHFEENYDDLKDFYKNIHNIDDLALCMVASVYADKDDVIEWVKANVFLPENYVMSYNDTWYSWWYNNWWNRRWDNTDWWNSSTNGNWNNRHQWWQSWRENQGWWRNLDSRESADKQVVSEQWIYNKAVEYWITDKRQIAYVLSTVKLECAFKNQKEIWWENRSYWKVDPSTWKAYYGRGFIQLTHKYNYEKYTEIIRASWKNFKDNNWNILNCNQIDLVYNPDIVLQSNDLAAFIIMDWMKNGWPDRIKSKRLDYHINSTKTDYYHARIIVNGMSSKPQQYADTALAYQNKIWTWSVDSSSELSDSHLIA